MGKDSSLACLPCKWIRDEEVYVLVLQSLGFLTHFLLTVWSGFIYEGYWRELYSRLHVECVWKLMAYGDAREGKWRRNWRMEWVASTLHTTLEHGVSIITNADAHTSAASSRLNWRPRRFKWTLPFRWKTKSGFCACAFTFQTHLHILGSQSNEYGVLPYSGTYFFFREHCLISSEGRTIIRTVKHPAGCEEGVTESEEVGKGHKSGVRCFELSEKLVESA